MCSDEGGPLDKVVRSHGKKLVLLLPFKVPEPTERVDDDGIRYLYTGVSRILSRRVLKYARAKLSHTD